MTVELSNQARKTLARMPPPVARQIRLRLNRLRSVGGHIHPLQKPDCGGYYTRAGNYRIFLDIHGTHAVVRGIRHRNEAFKILRQKRQ